MDHYTVLSVEKTASYEEIKAKYRELVLKFHPDKISSANAATGARIGVLANGGAENAENYRLVQKAWEVLRDTESRTLYNEKLSKYEILNTGIVNEQISLSEMEYDQDQELYFRECRCSGRYILYEEDLEFELQLDSTLCTIIGCDMCSLKIRIFE